MNKRITADAAISSFLIILIIILSIPIYNEANINSFVVYKQKKIEYVVYNIMLITYL